MSLYSHYEPKKVLTKSSPQQQIIDKVNQAIITAAKSSKTQGELEDDICRGCLSRK